MAVKINAGALKFKVILKAPVSSQNDEGGVELSYPSETIVTHAAVRSISQSRVTEAGYTTIAGSKEFIIRWAASRTSINKDWLMVYGGEDYIIDKIEQIEEGHRFIRIVANTKSKGIPVSTYTPPVDPGEPDPTGPVFEVTIVGGGNMQFYADLPVTVDWGDGWVEAIAGGKEHYYPNGTRVLKLYHHDNAGALAFSSNWVVFESVAGVLPVNLYQLSLCGGLTNLPNLPASVRNVDLSLNRLTVAQINELIDILVTNGQTDGNLQTRFQDPRAIPTNDTGLDTLSLRGWEYLVDT